MESFIGGDLSGLAEGLNIKDGIHAQVTGVTMRFLVCDAGWIGKPREGAMLGGRMKIEHRLSEKHLSVALK